ncbi:MAG: serine/threonine protein kinase, partial [Planctomycetaceae bacterium]
SSTVTRQGQQLGTVDYMSPEQIRDPAGVDARSDLYSLGCTLYFLLVGHPPFNEGNDVNRLMAHQQSDPVPPSKLRGEIPAELERICLRLMSKIPEDRFESARELTRHLVAWLSQAGGAEWAALNPVMGTAVQTGSVAASLDSPLAQGTGDQPALERSVGKTVAPLGGSAGLGTAAGGIAKSAAQPAGMQASSATAKATPTGKVGGQAAAVGTESARVDGQARAENRPAVAKSIGASSGKVVADKATAGASPAGQVDRQQQGTGQLAGTGVFAPIEDINVSVDLSQMGPMPGGDGGPLHSFLNQMESPGAFPAGEAFAEHNLQEGPGEGWAPADSPGQEPSATVIMPEGWTPGQDDGDGRRVLSDRGFREGAEEELFEASAPLERSVPSAGQQPAFPVAKAASSLEKVARRDETAVSSTPPTGAGTWQPPADDGSVNRRFQSGRRAEPAVSSQWKR